MKSKKEDVIVAYAADENVVIGLYISIHTILKNTSKNSTYRIIIIDGGIKKMSKEKIKLLAREKKNVIIEYKKAPDHMIKHLADPDNVGRAAYLLLLVPEVINRKKILYLDVDTVVTRDVKKLYNKNVEDVACLAVKEYLSTNMKHASRVTKLPQIIDCEPKDPYFNSGVLLINIERWLKQNVTSRAIEMLSKYPDKLSVDDQDALNGVLHNDWHALDFKWNIQLHFLMEKYHPNPKYRKPNHKYVKNLGNYEELLSKPGILHFNNHPKPWQMRYVGPYRKNYRRLMSDSGWRNKSFDESKIIYQIVYTYHRCKNKLIRDGYHHYLKPVLAKAANRLGNRP